MLDALQRARDTLRYRLRAKHGLVARQPSSLFTGLYPAQHRFISDKAVLPPSSSSRPRPSKPAGLFNIAHRQRLHQQSAGASGWLGLPRRTTSTKVAALRGEDLVAAAKTFLTKNPGEKPFFLYLGTIDAHVSWRAHEPWISKVRP